MSQSPYPDPLSRQKSKIATLAYVDSFRIGDHAPALSAFRAQRDAPQETNSICVDPGGTIGDTQFLGFQDGNLR